MSIRLLVAALAGALAAPSLAFPQEPWGQEWKLELSRGGSAPLVWADSMLVVASLDRNLHLVSTGTEPNVRWKDGFKGGFSAAPVVTPSRIYLPELDEGGRLVAIDRASRRIAWAVDAGDLAASPIVTDDRIFTASTLGELGAWSESGEELWTTELETRVTSRPALLGEVLVVASTDGRLHAINARSGEPIATTDPDAGPIWGDLVVLPAGAGEDPTAVFATLGGQLLEVGADLSVIRQRSFPSRFYAGPTRSGERLYLVGHEGTIWACDWRSDAIEWKLELDDATVRMAPALGEEYLAVGDLEGTLAIVDRSRGVQVWTTRLDGALTSTPLFRGHELFVHTESGSLYAFRLTKP
ncbi:outer membrane protein assembly factor BamB [soil metagenome]